VADLTTALHGGRITVPALLVRATYADPPITGFQDTGINAVTYANQTLRDTVCPMERVARAMPDSGFCTELVFVEDLIGAKALLDLIPEYFRD
jgi:hypothetical protein